MVYVIFTSYLLFSWFDSIEEGSFASPFLKDVTKTNIGTIIDVKSWGLFSFSFAGNLWSG